MKENKTIKVVIGAGFGDEGKGLMTDYFCNKNNLPEVLNVRFNGGSQAGHTVVAPDGKRHVFSHFGAGSFHKNVVTYLSQFFLVNPVKFMVEFKELTDLGISPRVIINKDCRVVLPYDAFINIAAEESRGDEKHGSCGAGIYEAVLRSKNNKLKVTVEDLQGNHITLFKKIKKIRDSYYNVRLQELNINKINDKLEALFKSDDLLLRFIEDSQKMIKNVVVANSDETLALYDYQVYEGAQGLILDWDNEEYAPHLTASKTGIKNVVSLLNIQQDFYNRSKKDLNLDMEVCYVTRSYLTRHGVGPFKTEVESSTELGCDIHDKTNVYNPFQENLRYGYYDLDLVMSYVLKDSDDLDDLTNKIKPYLSFAITHLDQTNDMVLDVKGSLHVDSFIQGLAEVADFYLSRGETRETITHIN